MCMRIRNGNNRSVVSLLFCGDCTPLFRFWRLLPWWQYNFERWRLYESYYIRHVWRDSKTDMRWCYDIAGFKRRIRKDLEGGGVKFPDRGNIWQKFPGNFIVNRRSFLYKISQLILPLKIIKSQSKFER